MRTTTTVTSTASLTIPYTCRCPFCGTVIPAEDKISVEGHAVTGGYATGDQKNMMSVAAVIRANENMRYEAEYAVKRLDHFRNIVGSGKLEAYLKSGEPRKEDWFEVEAGSRLGQYLMNKKNKTQFQVNEDTRRMRQFPYQWKEMPRKEYVSCPKCGQVQPWCYGKSCGGLKLLCFFIGSAIAIGLLAGLYALPIIPPPPSPARYLGILTVVPGALLGVTLFRILRRRALRKYTEMPWREEDMPQYDPQFIEQVPAAEK